MAIHMAIGISCFVELQLRIRRYILGGLIISDILRELSKRLGLFVPHLPSWASSVSDSGGAYGCQQYL